MRNQRLYPALLLYKKHTFFLLFFLAFCIFNIKPALAQNSLSIGTSPSSEKLQLQPGQKYNGEIVVWNLSNKTTNYQIIVRGFKQIENQPGTAIVLTDSEEDRSLYSASSWITLSKEKIELVPNKNEKIFYQIIVPEDITKGEYNAIIAFYSDTDQESAGTTTFTTLSSGTPILIKVGDDFVENAELLKFSTDKNFYEKPVLKFETRIKNIGDTHISPTGEVILTNIFNQEVGKITFNSNGQSILRDNSGTYETSWNYGSFFTTEKEPILGPINAKLVVTYRNFQPGFAPLIAETSFWIIPWKHILVTIFIIISTVILLKMRKNKKKEPQPLPK